MTDETTPGEPLESGVPVEPEAAVPSPEPQQPPAAADAVTQVITDRPLQAAEQIPPPEAAPTQVLQPVAEPGPAEVSQPAAAPGPVPVAPVAGLGPAVPSGSRVIVMVSRGPAPAPSAAYVTVPEVVGMAQGYAMTRLQESGLPTQIFNDYHPKLPRGEVMAQLPAAGAAVPAGSESVVIVSSGPSPVPSVATSLPNVVGLAEPEAVSTLQAAGLSPQLVREYSPTVPEGIAIAQVPNSASLISIPKRRSLAWLWVVLALLVVVAAGVGTYLFLNRTGVVPVVVGLSQADATAAIEAAGFKVASIDTTQTLKASDVGKVVAQSPAANTEARMIDGIAIVVSGGQKLIEVPAVTGKTQADAETALKNAGFQSTATNAFSSTVVKGVVISQTPEAGQNVPSDTSIGIVVSQGTQSITVPNVLGQTENQASITIKSLGLGSPRIVSNHSSTADNGRVAEQFPESGSTIPPNTIMGIVVSTGSGGTTPTVTVPALVGKTQSDADTQLRNLGLKTVVVQWSGTGQPLNQVVGAIPREGSLIFRNESVIVFVSNGQ